MTHHFVVIVFLYGIGLRFFKLGGHSLWYDELVTAGCAAQNSISDFFKFFVGAEQNPPGHHFFVWLLTRTHIIGTGEVSLRLLSALAGVGSLFLIYWIARKLWGARAGVLALLMLALHFEAIILSQEARPYALAIFFLLAHIASFLRGGTILSIISGILLAYSHYYGLFFLFFFALSTLVFYPRSMRWLVIYGACLPLYLPWLPTLLHKTSSRATSYMGAPNFKDVIDHWYHAFGHARLFAILFIPLLIWVLREKRQMHPMVKTLLAGVFCTYVFVFAGSHVGTPFLVSRYLMVLLGAWVLILAWTLNSLLDVPRVWRRAVVGICIVNMAVVIWSKKYYFRPKGEQNREAVELVLEWSKQRPIQTFSVSNSPEYALYYPNRLGLAGTIPWLPNTDPTQLSLGGDVALITHGEAWSKAAEGFLKEKYTLIETVPLKGVSVLRWRSN